MEAGFVHKYLPKIGTAPFSGARPRFSNGACRICTFVQLSTTDLLPNRINVINSQLVFRDNAHVVEVELGGRVATVVVCPE